MLTLNWKHFFISTALCKQTLLYVTLKENIIVLDATIVMLKHIVILMIIVEKG